MKKAVVDYGATSSLGVAAAAFAPAAFHIGHQYHPYHPGFFGYMKDVTSAANAGSSQPALANGEAPHAPV